MNSSARPTENSPKAPANRNGADFLNTAQTESPKTKSNLIQTPAITMPKGGGVLYPAKIVC